LGIIEKDWLVICSSPHACDKFWSMYLAINLKEKYYKTEHAKILGRSNYKISLKGVMSAMK